MSEKNRTTLFERLIAYSQSGIYPFCMPGHKRQNRIPDPAEEAVVKRTSVFSARNAVAYAEGSAIGGGTTGFIPDPYQLDITEVEGFDDLHRANGILKDITDRAGEIYAKGEIRPQVFMSVNGSTACNLAAVSSMPEEGPVLIAANCHRSVFNGAKITKRNVIELAPQWISRHAIYGGINPQDVENALQGYPDIQAVVITSPSYEGFVSDVKAIAEIVHAHEAYLIVDEAHGAHLPFCSMLPASAIYLGADIVIHSLHKTVGSLNQTALAFVNAKELAEPFHEKLLLFTTTSPSYLLMASIEQALLWADANRLKFDAYCQRLFKLRRQLDEIGAEPRKKQEENVSCKAPGAVQQAGNRLMVVDKSIIGKYNIFDLDQAKLMFYAKGVNGYDLYRQFYETHRLQFEKYGDRYALAMTTVWDTDEGFARLLAAAEEINRVLSDGM